jgi:hypothetical protein
MGQTLFGIAILVGFLIIGLGLIRNPKAVLASFDRPTTDKHIRAMRLIGMGFLLVVLMGTAQLLRNLR